jgi:Beta-propeller repeat
MVTRAVRPALLGLWALSATVLTAGCEEEFISPPLDGSPGAEQQQVSDTLITGLPDGYGPLWPCTVAGKACNAHDPCAIAPVCGADKLCRPTQLQICNDELGCTDDTCMGMGQCRFDPKVGACALAVHTPSPTDGGMGSTEIKCFFKGDKKPGDPCQQCDPDQDKKKWTSANGGYCDDKNQCTKDDYCQGGICKGTSFLTQCADQYGCTEDLCDGKGGCLGNKLKSDWCLIGGACYKDGMNDPGGSCKACDVKQSQSAWSTFTNSCQIDGKCLKPGDKHPLQCAECDPVVSKTTWTVKTPHCLIDGLCKKPGDKDLIGCASCDPTKNKYGWTPLSNLCKIGGKCHSKGDKHTGGCAECDPAVSGTAWTVKGSDCLINDVCKKPNDKDAIGCATCDPTKDRYDWTPIAGLCKISGTCYKSGDKHPGLCAECDPAVQSTAWTVKTAADCLIYNVCKKSGDKDLSGCASCQPSKSKYTWSALAGLCKIDGNCYTSGTTHPQGCGVCSPSQSTTSWTPTGTGCVIDSVCFPAGGKDPTGCGTCDPAVSKTAWTVAASSCIIGSKCYSQGSKEVGGCGTCDPAKNKTAWSKSSSCPVAHLWSKSWGSSSSDYPWDVAVDAAGNVYVTGYFYYSVNFGGATLTSKGSADVFLVSYTPSGKHRWSKSFGGSSTDYGYGLALDAAGNVYITGIFYNTINFGGTTLSTKGSYDVFVASFSSNGTHRWSKGYGSSSYDYGYDIAADSAGNVYVTGYYSTGANFGGTNLTTKGGYDVFLASYTSTGAHRWSKGFGSTSSDYGWGVATDGGGNVYLTGYFYNTINFGGATLTSSGSVDTYLASFTPAGVHRWSKAFGGTSSDYGYDVATDASGNVYVTGSFYYDVNFGGGKISSKGGRDIYIASFTPAGVHRWSKGFGSTSTDYGYGVAADAAGNVYLTGYFYSGVDFGGGTLTSKGSYDVFMASYTSSGAHRWSRSHGSTSGDYGRRVAADSAGNAYFAGSYYYTVDFGGGPFTSKGGNDIYLVKVGP